MIKTNFTFLSADNITTIHAMEIKPETENVKGIIQIVHGLSENKAVYEDIAERFVRQGYLVILHDQIGHGLSCEKGRHRNHFGEAGSRKYAIADIRTLRKRYEDRKDIPYILLGHSLGGFLVRQYLIDYGDVDMAVVSGNGILPKSSFLIMKYLVAIEATIFGYTSDSEMTQYMLHGANNKKLKVESNCTYDWLVKDPEGLKLFASEDNIGGKMTTGIVLELCALMKSTEKKNDVEKSNKDIPILFLAGKLDPSLGFGDFVTKLNDFYESCGFNTDIKLYENSRHCIFQDYDRDEAVSDILNFIKENS